MFCQIALLTTQRQHRERIGYRLELRQQLPQVFRILVLGTHKNVEGILDAGDGFSHRVCGCGQRFFACSGLQRPILARHGGGLLDVLDLGIFDGRLLSPGQQFLQQAFVNRLCQGITTDFRQPLDMAIDLAQQNLSLLFLPEFLLTYRHNEATREPPELADRMSPAKRLQALENLFNAG